MLKKIYVVSRTGALVDTIKRKKFMGEDKEGFPESHVTYKGKEYPTYELRGKKYLYPPNKNNLRGNAIYPWGTKEQTTREWAHDVATRSKQWY